MRIFLQLSLISLIYLVGLNSIGYGYSIVMVGDSHVAQSWGRHMHARLLTIGDAHVVGSCGSSPRSWFNDWKTPCGWFRGYKNGKQSSGVKGINAQTPRFSKLIEIHQPDVALIALGANLLNQLKSKKQRAYARKNIHKMLDLVEAAGVQCIWIGPPDGSKKKKPEHKQDALYDFLVESIGGRCDFINSRQVSMPKMKYPKKCNWDGGHWDACSEGKKLAVHWADEVFIRVVKAIEKGNKE